MLTNLPARVLNVKAVVAAFNQEKALVGAFSVITNLRMDFFEALLAGHHRVQPRLQPVLHRAGGGLQDQESLPLLPLQRLLRGHPQQAPQRRHRHLPLRVRPALVRVLTQTSSINIYMETTYECYCLLIKDS